MAQSQGGTICPECGAAVKPDTQFCGECGAKIPQAPQAAAGSSAVGAPPERPFKPRPKSRTVMGIDSQASKFASALAQVEARAKADTTPKKPAKPEAEAGPEQVPVIDEAAPEAEVEDEAATKARLAAEAEAEAIIARAQAEAEKAYATEDDAADPLRGPEAQSGEALAAQPAAASSDAAADSDTSAADPASPAASADAASADNQPLAEDASQPTAAAVAAAAPAQKEQQPDAAPGRSIEKPAPQPAAAGNVASPVKPAPKIIVPERGTPAAARAAISASKRGLAHTMLGLSDEVIKSASSVPSAAGSSSSGEADASALPRGVTPVPVTTVNTSGKRAGAAVPSRSAAKGTLLGIQTNPGSISSPGPSYGRSLDQTQIEGEQPEGGALASGQSASGHAGLGSTRVEGAVGNSGQSGTARTALGIGIPQAVPKRSGPQGRTMLGVPVASITPPAAADAARNSLATRTGSSPRAQSDESLSIPPSAAQAKRVNARTRNVIILASMALLTIIAMVYLRLSGSSDDAGVSARITTGAEGETLLFEVPDAREGSSIRFGGQEQPLVAGRATFALASDSLRVGENVVLADVVGPDGEKSSAHIVLSVFYRIWVDLASLRVDKPSVDVIVNAVPGTKVTLEGQDVPLDSQGHATKTYPVDLKRPGKGGVIEQVVHYRMQPPEGEPVADELHTRIAVAMMQIDRPGPDIVTDRESIEIAGAVGRDTQVDIDGSAVAVKDGRFQHTLALARPGDFKPRITAKASGKIPFEVTLSIKRVRDLAQAAREFSFNKDLNYAKIAAEPASYKGQSIAMEGRVYATVPRAGSSVIQMLARPCPASQRCSVWVVDPQGTEVSVDRFVRILGTVDGEQQFRSEKNEIVTVPKIIARFVLPVKP